MKSFKGLLFSLGFLSMATMLVGCGEPDYYKCSGVVMKDGKPLEYVQITFMPDIIDSTRPPFALAKEGGEFTMRCGRESGVPPGEYTIHIEDPGEADGTRTSTDPDYLYVIDRYGPLKSDLKYVADQHRTNFQLELPEKEYTGPEYDQGEVENTTDDQ